jgi:hypothetical protein
VKNTFLIACAIACLATPAFAQSQPPQSGPATGAYLAGVGGLTFGNGAETDKVYGGEIGVEATRNLTVYGTLGHMQNIASKSVQDTLDGSGLTAKYPATFGIVGLKYRLPSNSSVRPYVLGGGGVGHTKLKMTAAGIGDVTDAFVAGAGLDQSSDDVKATKFMYEMGAGLEIPVGPIYVDAGYRFGKFVDLEDASISRAYVGLGYRFGGNTK